MTYEDAVDWSIENIPAESFETFEEFRNQVASELHTPELMAEENFNRMLFERYNDINPEEEAEIQIAEDLSLEEIESMQQEEQPVEVKEEFRKENIAKTSEKFTFTERREPTIAEKFTEARNKSKGKGNTNV